jgi:dCMP deaminase
MDGKQKRWDEYFMDIAEVVARKSKDPSTKNGCVIVDAHHRPISFGYNGWVQGADESKMTWDERPMKYYFSIHSEMNALIFAKRDLTGCTLYNVYATCENCLKFLLQAGIARFVYRKFRVESKSSGAAHSMNDEYSDEAIVRLLRSMPQVEAVNLSNGKTYIREIIESYEPDSELRRRLESY